MRVVAVRLLGTVLFGLLSTGVVDSSSAQAPQPAEPRAGGEIRFERGGPAPSDRRRIVAGPGDELWVQRTHSVARWNGEGLDPSPVEIPMHPRWESRMAPPWNSWSELDLIALPGRGGALLVVAVRDIYQDAARDLGQDAARDPGTVAGGQMAAAYAERRWSRLGGPRAWLEGWLFAEGRWAGPLPIDQLVARERERLARDFEAPTPDSRFFDLQGDGEVVWYAYNGRVGAIPADGRLRVVEVPPSKNGRVFAPMNLIRRPDGAIWCTASTETGFRVVELRLVAGEIEHRPVDRARLDDPSLQYVSDLSRARFHGSRQGILLLERRPKESEHVRPIKWLLGDAGWTRRDDLGQLAFEDDDGSFWFLSGGPDTRTKERAFWRVDRDGTSPILEGSYRWLGPVLRLGTDRLLVAGSSADGLFLVVLERGPAGGPERWRIGARHPISSPMTGVGELFLHRSGRLLGTMGMVADLPAELRP